MAIGAVALFLGSALAPIEDASAQTDRSAYLIQLLSTSTAFRVRAQAALSLGGMGPSAATTQALVTALRDSDASVRAAAAQSLGRVGDASALTALRGLSHDPEPRVQQAATAAVASITARGTGAPPSTGTGTGTGSSPPPSGPARYYMGVGDAGSTVAGIDRTVLSSARTTVVSGITAMSGVVVAPAGETQAQARAAIGHLRGVFLDISITDLTTRPDGAIHCAVSIVVQDYPSHAIRSSLTAASTASGVSGPSGQRAACGAALSGALQRLPTALAAM